MNSWHQTKHESFDAPQEFVVVQPQIIVREGRWPDAEKPKDEDLS